MLGLMGTEEIVSFQLTEEGKIEVIKRVRSNSMYACNPPKPVPDRVWKEIYSAQDGVIKLEKKIEGTHNPSHVIRESLTFPE